MDLKQVFQVINVASTTSHLLLYDYVEFIVFCDK